MQATAIGRSKPEGAMGSGWRLVLLRGAATMGLVVAGLVLGGCALLLNPSSVAVPVSSTPAGAEVWVDGQLLGPAPLTVELDGRRSHEVEVRLGGRSQAWFLEPRWTGGSTADAAGDIVALVCLATGGGFVARMGGHFLGSSTPELPIIGAGLMALGVAPLIVDGATGSFYVLSAEPLEGDLR